MARRVLTGVGVNLEVGSKLAAGSTTVYTPDYILGQQVVADSGVYIYGQANGAVAEGYACKYVEGTFDFDTVTTSESGSTQTHIGVCVTAGGLADNQYGWFWRGCGSEYVYVKDSATIDTQMMTTTTAGQVGDSTDGIDYIHELFNNGTISAAGLALCRSSRLLCTNTTIVNNA